MVKYAGSRKGYLGVSIAMAIKGIDISNWNGTIDFSKVKNDGIEFVMVRGGWSTEIDPRADEYLAQCNKLGIPVGIYWFSYALSEADAVKEAKVCIALAQKYRIEYPIAYDFEDDSIAYFGRMGKTCNKQLATAIVNTFLNEITKAGYYAVNYSNANFLTNWFNTINFPLWLAAWYIQKPDRACQMWQHSSTGKVDGITGNVDMNYSYVDFPSYLKSKGYNHLSTPPWIEQASEWAKDGVDWAVKNGILEGVGGNDYALQKPVTREQLCTMLKRYNDLR